MLALLSHTHHHAVSHIITAPYAPSFCCSDLLSRAAAPPPSHHVLSLCPSNSARYARTLAVTLSRVNVLSHPDALFRLDFLSCLGGLSCCIVPAPLHRGVSSRPSNSASRLHAPSRTLSQVLAPLALHSPSRARLQPYFSTVPYQHPCSRTVVRMPCPASPLLQTHLLMLFSPDPPTCADATCRSTGAVCSRLTRTRCPLARTPTHLDAMFPPCSCIYRRCLTPTAITSMQPACTHACNPLSHAPIRTAASLMQAITRTQLAAQASRALPPPPRVCAHSCRHLPHASVPAATSFVHLHVAAPCTLLPCAHSHACTIPVAHAAVLSSLC
ncbi:hypothetical protein EVG20_g10288 [Dentipellis fragilis]|uniref:Uncharacterized protein n=1 Tax=Dentipellis fragilis TaxID=205917 RepID=A0A4Y9XSF6_9AGAM|nr:hypothetical protein EVG20_g10288 [Dentipellis fragilis]